MNPTRRTNLHHLLQFRIPTSQDGGRIQPMNFHNETLGWDDASRIVVSRDFRHAVSSHLVNHQHSRSAALRTFRPAVLRSSACDAVAHQNTSRMKVLPVCQSLLYTGIRRAAFLSSFRSRVTASSSLCTGQRPPMKAATTTMSQRTLASRNFTA